MVEQVSVQMVTTQQLNDLMQHRDNDTLIELVHGEIVEKMPTEAHGKLVALIAYFLVAFVRSHDIQAHVGVEVRHEVLDDPHNSLLPDVSLRFSDKRPVEAGAVPVMPDLAVEIQSPKDRPHHMRQKAHYYLQKGTRLVWLVYPNARQVDVCTLDARANLTIQTVTPPDALTGEGLLPDFRLPLNELFDS